MKYLYAVMAVFFGFIDLEKIKKLLLSKTGKFAGSVFTGYVMSLSLAPVNMWVLGVAGMVLFLMLSMFFETKKQVFFCTLSFFSAYAFSSINWIEFVMADFGKIPSALSYFVVLLFSTFYIALPYATTNAIAYKFAHKKKSIYVMCFVPVAFILGDVYIYYFLTGFPWTYIGYGFIDSPLKNYAPLTGVLGINLFVYIMCAALSLSVYRKYLFFPVAASILIFAVFLEGSSFVKREEQSVNVAMVQGNIEQSVRNDGSNIRYVLAKYWQLSKDLIEKDSLIIWPESAISYPYEYLKNYISDLDSAFKDKGATLITGTLSYKGKDEVYNSIITIGQSHKTGSQIYSYNKRALVPFGEVVPFASLLRPLGSIFVIPNSSFTYGLENQNPINTGKLSFTPAICYEAIFSGLVSSLDSKDTNGIVMLSVDSWFGPTKGPVQHLNIARMRAMELQKPMLRVTNSGISAYIDERGNIVDKLPSDVSDVLKTTFYPVKGQTLYSKFGNLFTYILCVILLTMGVASIIRKDDPNAEIIEKMVRS